MQIARCASTLTSATGVEMASYHLRVTVKKFSLKAASQRLCFPPVFLILCGPTKMHSPSYSMVLGSLPKPVNVRDAGGVKWEVGTLGAGVLALLMRTAAEV